MAEWVTIPLHENTRDRVRNLKRGGISYTELLEQMCEQYDPPEPAEVEP